MSYPLVEKKETKRIPDNIREDLDRRLKEALAKDKSHTKKLGQTKEN